MEAEKFPHLKAHAQLCCNSQLPVIKGGIK